YGTASYYRHLRFEPPVAEPLAAATAEARSGRETAYLAGLETSLAGSGKGLRARRSAGAKAVPGPGTKRRGTPPGAGPARARRWRRPSQQPRPGPRASSAPPGR